ncbi:hypothetical protein AB1Y20_006679 [Prymnesium parvum]|uniref:AB hydrolase-1 domain-containing protein n=1 Tax=Prymnesium parvum TaxID=97485 RepID=A0AB34J0Z4_PRYPA
MAPFEAGGGLVRRVTARLHGAFCELVASCFDLGWGIAQHSWPVTVLWYLCCAPFAELFFYLQCKRYVRVMSEATHATFVSEVDSRESERCWHQMTSEMSPRELATLLRSWFLPVAGPRSAPQLGLTRASVVRFVSWTLFNVHEDTLSPSEEERVHAIVERLEAALGEPLAAGEPSALRAMTYTLEPLAPVWKPLCFYLLLAAAHCALGVLLRLVGFRRCTVAGLRYWHRAAPAQTEFVRPLPPPPPPTVLFHGVGGLLPYVLWIAQLLRTTRGAIFLPLFPCGSLSALPHVALAERPLPPSAMARAVRQMLERHAERQTPRRAVFFAHSLGTAHLAAVLKAEPALAAAVGMADPICFLLAHPDVLYNFLYARPPLTANTFFHWAQYKLATSEPTTQYCFRRAFWWSSYWIHPTDLPCDSFVVLSGRDSVAEPYAVLDNLNTWKPLLAKTGVKMHTKLFDKWRHGWLLWHPSAQYHFILSVQRVALERCELEGPPRGSVSFSHEPPASATEWFSSPPTNFTYATGLLRPSRAMRSFSTDDGTETDSGSVSSALTCTTVVSA